MKCTVLLQYLFALTLSKGQGPPCWGNVFFYLKGEPSMLSRLQTQTLNNATPPTGIIRKEKFAITFEPIM